MTPDSKRKTAAKTPAKKTAPKKTAISTKKAPAKKVSKKAAVASKESTLKKTAKKTAETARKAPAKKAPVKPKTTPKPVTPSISISSEERWKMIAIAAYHKAENRGFAPGGELQDWTEAEQEIDELLMSG